MDDTIALLRNYYETIRRERDLRWSYDQWPARKQADKQKKWKLFNEWQETRDKRWDLEETVESYLMTRAPRTGA